MEILRGVVLFLACSLYQTWAVPPDAKDPRVVYPIRVDSQGHLISPDISSKYRNLRGSRDKRDTAEEDKQEESIPKEKLYIVINNEDEELFLKLTPNTKLITPYTVIEWVLEDGRRILKHATGNCFYTGSLQDAEQSLVAISNCGGLIGYIQTQNDSYFIEPLKSQVEEDSNKVSLQPHLIYKVDSITSKLNLSLQQDQEFQEGTEKSEGGSIEFGDRENDVTLLEVDGLFRRKRSSRLFAMRSKRFDKRLLRGNKKLKRRKREDEIPKFRRQKMPRTVPKFTREKIPKYADRRSTSTSSSSLWKPKFFGPINSSSERQKRDGSSETDEEGEGEISEDSRNSTIANVSSSLGSNPDKNEIRTDERKKTKKRNKKNRKKCKKGRKGSRKDTEVEGERNQTEDENKCKPRKPKRKLDKAEKEKSKQEKKERKRRKKEKRRKERERKRAIREKKRNERKKRRGKASEDDDTLEAEKGEKNITMTTTEMPVHDKLQDPFEGEPWDGYSPDLFWETDIAAGSSGLKEVTLGPSLNVTDPPKWLELVVAVDNTVIDFHGEDEVEKYVFTLFNIVSAIYEDPSLESSLQLVMLRIIFYKDEQQSQIKKGLAKKSLEAVNRWAERLHRVSPAHLRHDLAVWLTKSDLGGPSGYAPVSGVCQPSRSCTLNRDEGLTSAFIIAHEMGHVLGLSHDGDQGVGNTCQDEGFQGSVMAPLVAATFSRFHWSKCSKREYHRKASAWSCMLNKPQWKNATTISSNIQYQYSLDDQCRMEFGEGYALCRSFGMTDPCTHLWCSNSSVPHLCKTKKGPPLEGTSCGDHKWCRNGFCESITPVTNASDGQSPVRHNPQDGEWGPWSDWGPCSRTCDTGVSFKTRACDNPPPAWGGRRCRGKREEWKLCGTEECPSPKQDFRAQQCSLLNRIAKLDPRRAALAWLPYEPKKRRKKCRISCYSHNTNEVYIGREYMVDGTPCSYDMPDDICVQGKCISVGCDKVIGSKARRDECGVCSGDGGTCTQHNEVFEQVPPINYTKVAILPAGARNITVREDRATMNFLALTRNNSSFILNGERNQEPPKSFVSEGARFDYSSEGEQEMLQASGPLLKPITVMIHGSEFQESVQIITSFYTPVKEEYFQWEIGPYTACSVTCGGGMKHQTLVCRDRRSDLQVFHDRCRHLPHPKVNSTRCNAFGCETKWMVSPWEHCSATCGPKGVQERVVSCVTLPHAHYKNWTEGIVDPLRCADHPRPDTTRPCRRDPCPAHWVPRGWGECSVTCGVGEQEQLWECMGGGGNEVTYDCGQPPRQVRACVNPTCPPPPCMRDASEFCQMPVLYKYCKIPKYRTLCCHTCANVVH